MNEEKNNPSSIAGTIRTNDSDQKVFYRLPEPIILSALDSVSSATLTAITSAAPFEWHEEITNAWRVFEAATERDLELMTRDPEPIRRHITVLTKNPPRLPDKTMQAMADIVLKLRDRQRERRWWIAGIMLTAIAGPSATLLIQRLLN